MGRVFLKKCTFPQSRVHYVQYQYFLFCIRTQHGPAGGNRRLMVDCISDCISNYKLYVPKLH